MRRISGPLFVALIALLCVAFLYLQYRQTTVLRQELARVGEQLKTSEVVRMRAEQEAKSNAAAVQQFRGSLTELPRLRGEVAALRRDVAEKSEALAKVASETIASNSEDNAKPAVTAFGSEVRDFGAATPKRAVTSLIWAVSSGQRERLSELLELPTGVPEEDAENHYDFFANMLSNKFSRLEFNAINSVRPNPDGTLRLGITYRDPETGNTNPFPFMLRQHEAGWKVVVEGSVPKNF
jgi:hypothetical protein